MMPLLYLFAVKTKNKIRCFVKQPSKMVSALVFLGVILLSVYTSSLSYDKSYRSIDELYAIVFLVYTFLFVTISKNGFSGGATFFSMADVNLLFSSPIKSSRVLFFGMLEQLGKTLYMGAVVLFQYGLARQYYGITYADLIFIAFGYVLAVLFAQMTAMIIYIFTCDSERKKHIVKTVYYSVLILFAVYALIKAELCDGFDIGRLVAAIRSDVLYLVPVSGFVTVAVEGMCEGRAALIVAGLFCCAAFMGGCYLLITKIKSDFYEDVLRSTENSHSAIVAAKQGRKQEALPKEIRTGRIGFTKGEGASAVREKHSKENRRSKIFLLDRLSLALIAVTVLYCFVMPDITGVFVFSAYTMMACVSTGRWAKELTEPYIYLIPEKPFVKLMNLIWEQIPKIIVGSIICFIPVHFILRCDIIVTTSMIMGRISLGFLFVAANLVMQRIFGAREKKASAVTVYIILVTVLSLPSVVAGVFVSILIPFNPELCFFAMSAVNFTFAPLLLLLCRNVLEYSEYNYR